MITEKKLIEKGYKKHINNGFGTHIHSFQKRLVDDVYVDFNYFDFSSIDNIPFEFQFSAECQFELFNGEHVDIGYHCSGDNIDIEDVESFYRKFHKEFCADEVIGQYVYNLFGGDRVVMPMTSKDCLAAGYEIKRDYAGTARLYLGDTFIGNVVDFEFHEGGV